MNNIIYHNIIRKMEKKIEEEKRETEEVVRKGYPCTKDCYLKRTDRCKNRTKQCSWDLRSNFWKGADTLGKRKNLRIPHALHRIYPTPSIVITIQGKT